MNYRLIQSCSVDPWRRQKSLIFYLFFAHILSFPSCCTLSLCLTHTHSLTLHSLWMFQCVCLCVDLCDIYCLSWRENAAFFPNQREKCVESGTATKIAGLTHSLSALKYKFYPEGNSLFCLVQSTLHTYTHSEIYADSKVFIGTWEIINFVLSWQKWGREIIYIVSSNSRQFKFHRIWVSANP